jgi:hypothetical protein
LNSGAGAVFYTGHGAAATGRPFQVYCGNQLFNQNCVSIDTNGGAPALSISQGNSSVSGIATAATFTSTNPWSSAVTISGQERNKGTLKIVHTGEESIDFNSGALSIDLQATTSNRTAAGGIYVDSTTGSTTGNLLNLRQNGGEVFIIKPDGRVGFFNYSPSAMLDVKGYDPATTTLSVTTVIGQTAPAIAIYEMVMLAVLRLPQQTNLTLTG